MGKAQIIILREVEYLDINFLVKIKVLKVAKSFKLPEGFKVSFILIDKKRNAPLLILDNHAPFGYHLHTKLPEILDFRVELQVMNYEEALRIFLIEVDRLVIHARR